MARPWWDSEGQSRTEDGGLAERATGPAQRGGDRRCRPQSRGLRRLPFGGAALPATAGVELPERGHWIWEEWLSQRTPPLPPLPSLRSAT